jgi:uncharacterized protein GlcG (DUF336 family)
MRGRFYSSLIAGLTAFACTVIPAGAQTTAKTSPFQDLKTLTGTGARAMVDACRAFALKNNMQVTIVVLDSHGDILDFHRMDGAHLQAFRTAPLKAKAALFNRLPTKTLEERVAQGNATSLWLGDFPQHGGFPVMVDGKAVGSIGVGGGQGAQDDDCAQAAIEAVLGAQPH